MEFLNCQPWSPYTKYLKKYNYQKKILNVVLEKEITQMKDNTISGEDDTKKKYISISFVRGVSEEI